MSIQIDFTSSQQRYRLKQGGGKQQAIAKAIGIKKRPYPTVIDATAGLGKDALQLAALGCEVTLIERHSEIVNGLQHAIDQAKTEPDLREITTRMQLIQGSAQQLIPTLPASDVIYLDPMFPPRSKSALVKQDLRELHALVGPDHNNDDLLTVALAHAKMRVVVKRPKVAPLLGEQPPSFQLIGKSNRFDIYLISST